MRVRGALCLAGAGLASAIVAAGAPAAPIACTNAALISAIEAANANADATTIDLPASCTYTFSTPYSSPSTIYDFWYGPSALPAIASPVTINGNGATIARSAAAPPFRLLFVGADAGDADTFGYAAPTPGAGVLTVRDATLTGGLARGGAGAVDFSGGGGGAGMGGAIFSQGSVTLERVTLNGNAAQGGAGGAADNSGTDGGGGGGGVAAPASLTAGGGFGSVDPSDFPGGGDGNTPFGGGGGGGGGFRAAEDGFDPFGDAMGQGAGPPTGTGGTGGFQDNNFSAAGDGSGGGADGTGGDNGGAGGSFGVGALGGADGGGGGGGVGGGGGGTTRGAGGGGGFGGGGGGGFDDGDNPSGGNGGFGGGGGGGESKTGGAGGDGQGPGGVGLGGFGAGAGGLSPDTDGTTGGAGGGGGAGMGGAVFNHQGTVSIVNSTLSGNTAVGGTAGSGGASGVAGTSGQGLGGAVFNLNGSVSTDSATIAGNTGGGVYTLGYLGNDTGDPAGHVYAASTTLANSIVADSTGASDLVVNAPATVAGGGANTATSSVNASDHDLVETRTGTITGSPLTSDPGLGPLAANGGLTQTRAITSASPAFNAGATAQSSDQRGIGRPQGAADDIGAFELQVAVAPTVTTDPATSVTSTGASLNVTINPGGSVTTYKYEYGPTTAFGTLVPSSGTLNAGAGFSAVSQPAQPITGLSAGTTYYFRACANNSVTGSGVANQVCGAVRAFTTSGTSAPSAATSAATAIANTTAQLNGSINAHGAATVYVFEYGTSTTFSQIAPVPSGNAGAGTATQPVSTPLSGLQPRTTYYYRLVATNAQGTTRGPVMAFTTTGSAVAPSVTTAAASNITQTGALLKGTINPHGQATTFTFEYGTTTSFGHITSVDNAGNHSSTVAVSLPVSGLSPDTTYLYRIVATNATGTTRGAVMSFTTAP